MNLTTINAPWNCLFSCHITASQTPRFDLLVKLALLLLSFSIKWNQLHQGNFWNNRTQSQSFMSLKRLTDKNDDVLWHQTILTNTWGIIKEVFTSNHFHSNHHMKVLEFGGVVPCYCFYLYLSTLQKIPTLLFTLIKKRNQTILTVDRDTYSMLLNCKYQWNDFIVL